MVIVYQSNTGHTREYAQMLARAEKMKVYELSEVPEQMDKSTQVLYMGPLMANHIASIDKVVKRFQVKAVCAVGMTPPGQVSYQALGQFNYVPDAPIFYLQGGWAPDKVSWMKRRMVNAATKSNRVALQEKSSRRTAEEQAQLDMLLKGGSFVTYQNLEAIRNWLKEQNNPSH